MRRQIQERERELETLSKNKDRLRLRQSSRGSQGGNNSGTRSGPNEDYVKSGTIASDAYSYKRDGSQGAGSYATGSHAGGYKRDKNSPLREK